MLENIPFSHSELVEGEIEVEQIVVQDSRMLGVFPFAHSELVEGEIEEDQTADTICRMRKPLSFLGTRLLKDIVSRPLKKKSTNAAGDSAVSSEELTKRLTESVIKSLREEHTNLADYYSVLKRILQWDVLDTWLLNREAERVFHTLQFQLISWLLVLFVLWSTTLTVRRRDNDVLHRRCFIYLLLIRACIETNPGPDTTGRVYEIKLDDSTTMRDQLRNMRQETLKGIFSFMENITQRRCISYTTLHLYVQGQSEHDLRLYMIMSEKYWPEINSDNSHLCTPPEFLAYRGPNQTDILICHKTSANFSGFDLLSRCISQTCSESISYIRRSDDPFDLLYTQHMASFRLPMQFQYNNGLYQESPKCSVESEHTHLEVCDVLWIEKHNALNPKCEYAENRKLLDGCLRIIYIRTEVPRENVSALSDTLIRRAVDDQTFEIITDDMGFPMEIFQRAVQRLANKCNHLPKVGDIVSAIEKTIVNQQMP